MPVNVFFVLLLVTSVYALRTMSVPMVTVFKNLGVTFIAIGDKIFFDAKHPRSIIISIFLLVISSLVAAYTDL